MIIFCKTQADISENLKISKKTFPPGIFHGTDNKKITASGYGTDTEFGFPLETLGSAQFREFPLYFNNL